MVFASQEFLGFLAILLVIYWLIGRRNEKLGKFLLIGASLVFYGYWIPAYLLLLAASILFNHAIVRAIIGERRQKTRRLLTMVGVALNLALIGHYKYAAFLVESLNWTFQTQLAVPDIILPIGISFFTFQQISLLVDANEGRLAHVRFWDHVFFISFFPQLIAGPIVRQHEMLPQLRERAEWRLHSDRVAIGIALFSIGLFKKSALIDPFVPHIDLIYLGAETGTPVGFIDAWVASIGYGFQIYFDFSAYADMAIGLGCMFGVRLPINFFSPYKADSIRAFWRRWHITLSRFLRDYLFIPLGGSRHGLARTALALIATMGLAGLWHGAAWTFVVWGLIHGAYLSINHAWRTAIGELLPGLRDKIRATPILAAPLKGLSIAVTFLAVNFAWVFFRASDFDSAFVLVKGMLGLNGWAHIVVIGRGITTLLPLYLFIVWFLPNTMEIFQRSRAALHVEDYRADAARRAGLGRLSFSFSRGWAATTAVVFVLGWFTLSNLAPFIYFQF